MKIKGVNLGNWLVLEKLDESGFVLKAQQRKMNIIFRASFPRKCMRQGLRSIAQNTLQNVIL